LYLYWSGAATLLAILSFFIPDSSAPARE